jgi:prepilin-type N-terminal cleavage/methylation domain-containing protein
MFVKRCSEESGYSLVEVMASIIILAIAILPMAGMFDMGLRTATTGSNYDKARTLANLKLEEAKSLPFDTVKDNFPVNGSTPDTTTGDYQSAWLPESGPASVDFTGFDYMVEKQVMAKPSTDPAGSSEPFGTCATAGTCATETNLIRITVTVRFPNDSGAASPKYATLGLVTR